MEIREVEKTVTVKSYKCIASDGKVFASQCECLDHERKLKEKAACEIVDGMTKLVCTPPDGDFDNDYPWYVVKSSDELEALKTVFFYDLDATAHEFSLNKFPALVRLTVFSNGTGDIENYDDILFAAEHYLDELQALGDILDCEKE